MGWLRIDGNKTGGAADVDGLAVVGKFNRTRDVHVTDADGSSSVTLFDTNNSGGTTLTASQTTRPWFFEGIYTYRLSDDFPFTGSKIIGEGVFSHYNSIGKTLVE